jgi:hypothetical protein
VHDEIEVMRVERLAHALVNVLPQLMAARALSVRSGRGCRAWTNGRSISGANCNFCSQARKIDKLLNDSQTKTTNKKSVMPCSRLDSARSCGWELSERWTLGSHGPSCERPFIKENFETWDLRLKLNRFSSCLRLWRTICWMMKIRTLFGDKKWKPRMHALLGRST